MITPAILVGGILFWVAVVLFLVAFVISEANGDNNTTAWTGVVITAIFVGILVLFSDATLPDLSWQIALIGVGGYLVAGISWTLISWVRFLTKMKASLQTLRRDSDDPGLGQAYTRQYGYGSFPPQPSSFKGLISRWLIWWPVSLFCFCFFDLLSDLFEGIYNFLAGFLTRLSVRIFE